MPKFNVEVSYEVTEVYEIEAKDADFARIKATNIYRYAPPIDRRVGGKRVESITQVSPRYEIKVEGPTDYSVMDTKWNDVVAHTKYLSFANVIVDALNDEEEAE